MNNYVYVTFELLHHALHCEKVCKQNKLPGKLVSIPRQLSSGCGYAWRSSPDLAEKIEKVLTAHGVEFHEIHIL